MGKEKNNNGLKLRKYNLELGLLKTKSLRKEINNAENSTERQKRRR